MKNCLNALFLIFFAVLPLSGQDYMIEGKSVSSAFELKDRSSQELYDDILAYYSSEENSESYTIASEDREQGVLKLEQTSKVFYRNLGKLMYPNRSGMAELLSAEFVYHHEITVSEGSYMIQSEVIGMNKEMYGRDDLFFDCLDFDQIREEELGVYNESMDKLLKMNVVFKGRRQIFKDNSRSQFEDASQNILSGMLSDMGDLYTHLKDDGLGMK